MTTVHAAMLDQIKSGQGFIAALDQSGGSTPKALKGYGIEADAFSNDEEMFGLIHDMRSRIVTAPCFNGDKVIGAILFERTMDGEAGGKPVPALLWERGVVPFLKVDKGLEDEADGVQLMKPNPGLDALCERAVAKGVFGTKMRSVVNLANPAGIKAIVEQQFAEANNRMLIYSEQIVENGEYTRQQMVSAYGPPEFQQDMAELAARGEKLGDRPLSAV